MSDEITTIAVRVPEGTDVEYVEEYIQALLKTHPPRGETWSVEPHTVGPERARHARYSIPRDEAGEPLWAVGEPGADPVGIYVVSWPCGSSGRLVTAAIGREECEVLLWTFDDWDQLPEEAGNTSEYEALKGIVDEFQRSDILYRLVRDGRGGFTMQALRECVLKEVREQRPEWHARIMKDLERVRA